MFDLIIHNGRVVDYKNHLDQVTDIAVKDGRIASIGTALGKAKSHLDAKNLLVIPGIVDSHMHASSWLGGPDSLKMLALAGVTTAIEMAGPVDSVKKFIKENGTGLNIGCLEQLRPAVNLSSNHPSSQEILRAVQIALKKGAFGVKLLGGHYPLEPESVDTLFSVCSENGTFLAVHAGSTKQGSNIRGMEEIIKIANGRSFHLAHINAYCRGAVLSVEEEIRKAEQLLEEHPEILCESYLSPINGCSGKCIDGVPESGVTRNCLIAKGYAPTIHGLRAAIEEGAAHVHERADGVVILTNKEKGLKIWSETQTDVPMSFEVNPALPRFFFATQKRKDGKHFLVDAFCTDGGGIPRNVIISSGFSLVKLGALSLQEFVFKSSYSATRLYGLKNKGHFSPGADADITIIDFERQKPIHSFVEGKEVLVDGCVKGQGGKFITTQEGLSACKEYEIEPYLIDIKDIFSYRTERFAKNQ